MGRNDWQNTILRKKQLILLIVGVSIFSIGWFAIGIFFNYFLLLRNVLKNYEVTSQWEKVPCKIVSIGISTKRVWFSGGDFHDISSVQAEYKYEYKGKSYIGNRFGFQDECYGVESLYRQSIKKTRNQTKSTCYVNPDDPEEAILHPKTDSAYIYLCIGTLCFAIAFFVPFKMWPLIKINIRANSGLKSS